MSCLFIAVGRALRVPHAVLRAQICDFVLSSNPTVVDHIDLHTWIQADSALSARDYAHKMSESHEWGGAIEIFCMTRLYSVQIVVHHPNFTHAFGNGTQVHLGYTGSHYTLR